MLDMKTIVALALLLPAAAGAQQPPPQVESLMVELQQVQAQLQPLQEQALQDSAIRAEQTAVSSAVRDAMLASDPAVGEKLARLEALMAEARAAQQDGNTTRIAELTTEAQAIQPAIVAAQNAALAQPEIEERIAAFQTKLRGRILEIDPEARPLLDRQMELERQIRAAVGGGPEAP